MASPVPPTALDAALEAAFDAFTRPVPAEDVTLERTAETEDVCEVSKERPAEGAVEPLAKKQKTVRAQRERVGPVSHLSEVGTLLQWDTCLKVAETSTRLRVELINFNTMMASMVECKTQIEKLDKQLRAIFADGGLPPPPNFLAAAATKRKQAVEHE
jgi:hypothetical protein